MIPVRKSKTGSALSPALGPQDHPFGCDYEQKQDQTDDVRGSETGRVGCDPSEKRP